MNYYNKQELSKLPGKTSEYISNDNFTAFNNNAQYDHYIRLLNNTIPKIVSLKIGAQVMLTYNQDVQGGLCNGSRGVVIGYVGDGVEVKFLNRVEIILRVERTYKTRDNKVVGRTQMPLIVAYSTTIHKSQGATLDYIVVDIGTSVFLPAQAYVALSRCRTLEGTFICAFTEKSITNVDKEALNFLRELHERTGGNSGDLVDGSSTLAATALAAAQAAQASANDAHLLAFAAQEDAEQIDHDLQKDDELLHFWFYD